MPGARRAVTAPAQAPAPRPRRALQPDPGPRACGASRRNGPARAWSRIFTIAAAAAHGRVQRAGTAGARDHAPEPRRICHTEPPGQNDRVSIVEARPAPIHRPRCGRRLTPDGRYRAACEQAKPAQVKLDGVANLGSRCLGGRVAGSAITPCYARLSAENNFSTAMSDFVSSTRARTRSHSSRAFESS